VGVDMSYDLQLKKGGVLITNEWDGDFADYLEQIVDGDEIIFYLYDTICLDNNITLRDVFLMISKNIDIFSSAIGCPFLDDLMSEALSAKVLGKGKDGMGHLELSRTAVFDNEKLFIYMDFCGKGLKETWAIEFSPANELTSYPIILNENISIENNEGNVVFECKMSFTLLDFVKGIIDELSFVGPPDIKAFALQELKDRADSAVSGDAKSYSFEEVMEKFENKREKYKIPCKICGKDARSAHFGKPSTMCYKCFRKIKEN
jgi:hypothetical protein